MNKLWIFESYDHNDCINRIYVGLNNKFDDSSEFATEKELFESIQSTIARIKKGGYFHGDISELTYDMSLYAVGKMFLVLSLLRHIGYITIKNHDDEDSNMPSDGDVIYNSMVEIVPEYRDLELVNILDEEFHEYMMNPLQA